uniref:Uncharacterized protein n=1 Tax=Schizaphis graminum TaxID=13262 RepID=A0A2S2P0U0_SCHGA
MWKTRLVPGRWIRSGRNPHHVADDLRWPKNTPQNELCCARCDWRPRSTGTFFTPLVEVSGLEDGDTTIRKIQDKARTVSGGKSHEHELSTPNGDDFAHAEPATTAENLAVTI